MQNHDTKNNTKFKNLLLAFYETSLYVPSVLLILKISKAGKTSFRQMPWGHLRFLTPVSEWSFSSWVYDSGRAAEVTDTNGGPDYFLGSVTPKMWLSVQKKKLLVSVIESQDLLYTVSCTQNFPKKMSILISSFFASLVTCEGI